MNSSNPTIIGLVIPVEGPSREVTLETLADMQRVVGGYIEALGMSDGSTMYVNEEGRINGLPVNYFAGDVLGLGGRGDLLLAGVCGDALLVGPLKGEYDSDVTDRARRWVHRVERERPTVTREN